MADLSTISTASPADGDNASAGASKIRETRDAVITSFDVEHALAGPHTFLSGNGSAPGFAGAPAAAGANAGRLFLDTTNNRLLRDNGGAWIFQKTAHAQTGSNNAGGTLTNSFVTLTNSLFTVNVPDTSAIIKLEASIVITGVSVLGQIQIQGFIDSAVVMNGVPRIIITSAGANYTIPFLGTVTGLSAGNHTVEIQAACQPTTAVTWNYMVAIATLL